jgi:hypothetical protein
MVGYADLNRPVRTSDSSGIIAVVANVSEEASVAIIRLQIV